MINFRVERFAVRISVRFRVSMRVRDSVSV